MMTGMMNIYMPLLMGFMAYSLASGLALYFLVSNIFTIVQYAALGTLHPENLKFWEKKKPAPVPATAKRRPASSASSSAAKSESAAPAKKIESAKPKASAKADDDNAIFTQKIDYREFKNHKKPKKNQDLGQK